MYALEFDEDGVWVCVCVVDYVDGIIERKREELTLESLPFETKSEWNDELTFINAQ